MRLLMLVLVAITVAACSDRVPTPVTPTPTPRPGYPPAPASELPEGVLYVQGPTAESKVFRMHREEDAAPVGAPVVWPVSPERSRAVALTYGDRGVVLEIGILTGDGYEPIVEGEVIPSSPAFVWSKDGKRLGYTVPRDPASTQVEVWAFDAETGEKRGLSPEPGIYWLLGWTAGGEVLARTPDGLAQLGRIQREIPLPEPGDVVDAAMSPDGQSLAMTVGEYEQSGGSLTYVHSSGIWILGLSDGQWKEIVDLADEPPGVQTTGGQEMQWSPDGRRIAVHKTRMDDGMVADSLSVLDAETGKETLVHKLGWGWESWSPDGQHLAYMHYAGIQGVSADQRLGILGPDGRKRDVEAHVRQMAWTRDGRLLLDIPGHLSLLDPQTMRMQEVVTDEGKRIFAEIEGAVWSPGGRYVAVSTPSDQYHRSSLYVVDTEEGTAELFLDEAGFSAVAWLSE